MLTPRYKWDGKALRRWLDRARQDWNNRLMEAVRLACEDVEAEIQATQWGGRPGLNIRTARLYGSLWYQVTRMARAVKAVVGNRGAPYWWYHDKSGTAGTPFTRTSAFGRPTRPYEVTMPARTDVFGLWETAAVKFYRARAQEALRGSLALGLGGAK